MSKVRIRNAGNRSNGGRPRQEGERTASGRLKPPGPNKLVIERRKALCDDVTKASNPLDAAHYRGWISAEEYETGQTFARLHAAAGFGGRGGGAGAHLEVEKPTEVSGDVTDSAGSFFSGLPHAEVTALWDAVFNDDGVQRQSAEDRAAKAMKNWKIANASMSVFQRAEVNLVCIEQSFPQWIIQRAAGRMDTSWEAKRTLLIDGLRAVRLALKKPTPATGSTPEPVVVIPAPRPTQVIEREIRVDEDGGVVLEVERIGRRLG